MTEPETTIIVKHLPSELTDQQKTFLLERFGATNVKLFSYGKMKNIAFACYPSKEEALLAIKRLHQIEILGCRLCVELSNSNYRNYHPSRIDCNVKSTINMDVLAKSNLKPEDQFWLDLHNISQLLKAKYPINPELRYNYPPVNKEILKNISAALASVPKFYTQVLHLMNKMNLPPPFNTVFPCPIDIEILDGSESEIESSFDRFSIIRKRKLYDTEISELPRKKHKLQKIHDIPTKSPKVELEKIFNISIPKCTKNLELPKCIKSSCRNVDNKSSKMDEVVGFGKLQPPPKSDIISIEKVTEPPITYFSKDELKFNQMSNENLQKEKCFKKYQVGEKSCRLYVKNLSKKTTEKELKQIYGAFINHSNDLETNAFDVRLMQSGRMKGQAFISFSSEEVAAEALSYSNGYILHNKPIIVSFARSAKIKLKDNS